MRVQEGKKKIERNIKIQLFLLGVILRDAIVRACAVGPFHMYMYWSTCVRIDSLGSYNHSRSFVDLLTIFQLFDILIKIFGIIWRRISSCLIFE